MNVACSLSGPASPRRACLVIFVLLLRVALELKISCRQSSIQNKFGIGWKRKGQTLRLCDRKENEDPFELERGFI